MSVQTSIYNPSFHRGPSDGQQPLAYKSLLNVKTIVVLNEGSSKIQGTETNYILERPNIMKCDVERGDIIQNIHDDHSKFDGFVTIEINDSNVLQDCSCPNVLLNGTTIRAILLS